MIQSITPFENGGNGNAVRYFLAQHMPDVHRMETRNVGIVVNRGGDVTAKFVGEREDEALDGRIIKQFSDPTLYRMWVRHWRKTLQKPDWHDKLLNDDRITYSMIPGGEVTGSGDDSIDTICAYLFSLLVSEGGLREAMDAEDDTIAAVRDDLRSELRNLKIMRSVAPNWVRHPVYEDRDVKGTKAWHQVTFYQETETNGWVFEPLNLSTPQKKLAKQRAGFLAFIFGDFRAAAEANGFPVNTTAVIRVNDDEYDDPHVKYALSLLESNADSIVNWMSPRERKSFLREREAVAVSL